MNREQLIESMVAQVMEEFDFDYVHNVMVNLDLKWYIRGEEVVPTTYQIIKKAEKLLIDTANHYGEKEFYSCETGNLAASLNEGTLSLQFVLTEAFSYVEELTKTEDWLFDHGFARIDTDNLFTQISQISQMTFIFDHGFTRMDTDKRKILKSLESLDEYE